MHRTLLPLILIALLLPACGGGDNKQAEAQAALEAARPEYEARKANIESALKQAAEWQAKDGVPALEWGDRPAPKFLDVRKNKFDKEANARVFELKDGALNTDALSMLGLFADREWPKRQEEQLDGKALTKGAAESALEKYKGVRYLCLLITDDFKEAEFGSGTLFTIKFQPGHWKGRALYFDLEENKLIGGKQIEATNSSKIDFKTKDLKPEEQQKAARQAAEEDLRAQILQAAQNP
ncbi:MAG: hypothetical protein KDB82_15760 [Planctomycetes bacterium]|nr:hypothetical protein [Planctomycetota bacterium]